MHRVSQRALGFVTGILMSVAPAFATPVTFAGYVQANSNQDFSLVTTNLGAGLFSVHITGSGLVNFTYLVGGTPFDGAAQSAVLSFDATSTFTGNCTTGTDLDCTQNGDAYTETGFLGSFSITRAAAFMGLSNLLSGTFSLLPPADPNRPTSGGKLSSTIGGTGGAYDASQNATNPNQVVLASDFLNFSGTNLQDASFSFSSVTPLFSVQGSTGNTDGFPNDFSAAGTGTFSSQPAPSSVGNPEPNPLVLIGSALVVLAIGIRRKLM